MGKADGSAGIGLFLLSRRGGPKGERPRSELGQSAKSTSPSRRPIGEIDIYCGQLSRYRGPDPSTAENWILKEKRFSTPVTSFQPGPGLDFYIYNIKITVPGQQPCRYDSAEKWMMGIPYPLPRQTAVLTALRVSKMGDVPGETQLIGERHGRRTPTPKDTQLAKIGANSK